MLCLLSQMKERTPLTALAKAMTGVGPTKDFVGALRARMAETGYPALIAEVKKASPSRGVIQPNFDPVMLSAIVEALSCTIVDIIVHVQQLFKFGIIKCLWRKHACSLFLNYFYQLCFCVSFITALTREFLVDCAYLMRVIQSSVLWWIVPLVTHPCQQCFVVVFLSEHQEARFARTYLINYFPHCVVLNAGANCTGLWKRWSCLFECTDRLEVFPRRIWELETDPRCWGSSTLVPKIQMARVEWFSRGHWGHSERVRSPCACCLDVHFHRAWTSSHTYSLLMCTSNNLYDVCASVKTEKLFRWYNQCPLLCKEFIIDAWQIYKARVSGADAVLLIAAVLPDQDLAYMSKIAKALGMAALIEVCTAIPPIMPLRRIRISLNLKRGDCSEKYERRSRLCKVTKSLMLLEACVWTIIHLRITNQEFCSLWCYRLLFPNWLSHRNWVMWFFDKYWGRASI